MTTNDILKRIRYMFDYSDSKMLKIYALGDDKTTREQISAWMKKEDDPEYVILPDLNLSIYLNGLITERRGQKEGVEKMIPEKHLNNNLIFKKIKIALDLKSEDIIQIFSGIEKTISPHEISSFLRKPTQNQYRPCHDQYLRNFMDGLQRKYRP